MRVGAPDPVAFTPLTADDRQKRLGAVFRTVRLHRRLRINEVACAIDVCRRTYENIEAGRGRIEVEHVYKFAVVTRSDAYTLLAAVEMASPEWAVRTIEAKTMMVAVCTLASLDATLGDDVRHLEQSRLIFEMDGVCERLVDCVRQSVQPERVLEQRSEGLAPKPQPQDVRRPEPVADEE